MTNKLYYMSGAGNLFTVADNRDFQFNNDEWHRLASSLCNISELNEFQTEGLLIIDKSSGNEDFDVLFFNPDGSSGMMCGNGGRCAIRFAQKQNLIKSDSITFTMAGKKYKGKIINNSIQLFFQPPNSIKRDCNLILNDKIINYDFIDIGSEHVIIDYKFLNSDVEIREFDLMHFAPEIRYHKDFIHVNGVNVNLYYLNEYNEIELRTYERGVEAETGACGTGAISTAIIASQKYKLESSVKLIPPSKIPLFVHLNYFDWQINEIILEGHAEIINHKIIDFNLKDRL